MSVLLYNTLAIINILLTKYCYKAYKNSDVNKKIFLQIIDKIRFIESPFAFNYRHDDLKIDTMLPHKSISKINGINLTPRAHFENEWLLSDTGSQNI